MGVQITAEMIRAGIEVFAQNECREDAMTVIRIFNAMNAAAPGMSDKIKKPAPPAPSRRRWVGAFCMPGMEEMS